MTKALSWLSRDGHLIDIRDNIEDIPFRQKLSESLNTSISIETLLSFQRKFSESLNINR